MHPGEMEGVQGIYCISSKLTLNVRVQILLFFFWDFLLKRCYLFRGLLYVCIKRDFS